MNNKNEQYGELYFTKQRAKRTGNIWNFAIYGREIGIGKLKYKPLKKEKFPGELEPIKPSPEEIRVKTQRRAKTKLIDLVNCNVEEWRKPNGEVFPAAFLTLTVAENLTDINIGLNNFKNFIQRLNWEDSKTQGIHLKYVAVIEFQKRGAIHFHIVLFNMKYIPKNKLEKIWGLGFIKVRKVNEVKDVGFYVTKYMVKNLQDTRLKGHKSYLRSDGLLKPEIYYFEEVINQVKRLLPKEARDGEPRKFEVKYLRSIEIERYNLKNFPFEKEQVTNFLNSHV